jgi:hypothetical protein|tara:strand:- start:41 stop:250 length:210 start_codon:yes stop_codon:yes gene_type:complete
MMVLLGDLVTVRREVGSEEVFITGRVNGIVQKDDGSLKYFYVRGIDTQLWMSDGWVFETEPYDEEEEEK